MTPLPDFVQAMLDPAFYPERPQTVQLLQTQMSFVFIAGPSVYKVKKPVNLGYLDYSDLESRRGFCERETVLNRRLCPEVYLGVVPIIRRNGQFALGGDGEIVEYSVKMKSLPEDKMLNVLLARNEVAPSMIDGLSQKVADFHKIAESTTEISAFGDLKVIKGNCLENFDQTEKSVGRAVSLEKYQRIKSFTLDFLASNESLFQRRVEGKKIRDCHGDLHAAHICFTDGICIYDCIEFNDRFRYGDVASEVAFLAMDLDHYGRADLSLRFVDGYVHLTGDRELLDVLRFYKCYRAYVRGKVESFKLDDKYLPKLDRDDALKVASHYFDLASFYSRSRPSLLITAGVTGTGKTTAALAIARRTGFAVISSDIIRKELAGIPLTERRHDILDTGLYSAEFTRRTYDTMLGQARDMLARKQSVILDATFARRADRNQARMTAADAGADFLVLDFRGSRETIARRLKARSRGLSVSDGRIEILDPQMERFEQVDEVPENSRVVFDLSRKTEDNIADAFAALGES